MTDKSPYMTPAEVGNAFGVCQKTVVRWANAGKLAHIRTPGNHRRFVRAHIESLIRDKEAK